MVEKGATTMWERWNSDTGDIAMNSYNHYAFGAITDFLFRRVAGVAAVEPGFQRIRVAPIYDPRLGHAGADYDSIVGRIRTDWRIRGAEIELEAALPPNVTGEVVLPGRASQIRMGGRPLRNSRLAFVERDGATAVTVPAGEHHFSAKLAQG
jgi:alpha-L-rhamnosidase